MLVRSNLQQREKCQQVGSVKHLLESQVFEKPRRRHKLSNTLKAGFSNKLINLLKIHQNPKQDLKY